MFFRTQLHVQDIADSVQFGVDGPLAVKHAYLGLRECDRPSVPLFLLVNILYTYSWCTEKKWNRNVKKLAETVDGKSKVGRSRCTSFSALPLWVFRESALLLPLLLIGRLRLFHCSFKARLFVRSVGLHDMFNPCRLCHSFFLMYVEKKTRPLKSKRNLLR